ncbi:hypothetical protein ES705_24376 [subsurface metagenome]
MNQKYAVDYFEAPNCLELTEKVNEFFERTIRLSICDVAYLSEMRANRLNPSQAVVFFVCIVTYEILDRSGAG